MPAFQIVQATQNAVILSEHSESKDLRIINSAKQGVSAKILRLRAAPSAQDDKRSC